MIGSRFRRRSVLSLLVAALAVVVAGCGGGPAPRSGPAADGAAVVVTHGLGRTTIPGVPQRIVAIGGNDGDALLALGITPVAVVEARNNGLPPWLAGRLDPARTEVLTGPPNLEKLAALRPDLILAGSVPNIRELYPKLSEIAPTVTYQHGMLTDSWQDRLRLVARAVSRVEQAEKLIAETQTQLAGVLLRHPGLRDKTISISWANSPGSVAVLGGDSNTADLLHALGVRITPALLGIQSNGLPNIYSSLPQEQWGRLDADIVLVAGQPALTSAVRASPLVANLPAVRNGTYREIDLSTVSALRVPSVLNVPWLVGQLEPTLTRASEL